eukprot:TRINITY_DN10615_c0_g1_i1.p1 TRINITY_DN10615_c0_g1~~TRINITY_DN10615_c0_g1_i1.p1  ORF type:complete len:360 (+),score=59.25 TRINITY_DN10615_c0_g1_i1:11-1090(+)
MKKLRQLKVQNRNIEESLTQTIHESESIRILKQQRDTLLRKTQNLTQQIDQTQIITENLRRERDRKRNHLKQRQNQLSTAKHMLRSKWEHMKGTSLSDSTNALVSSTGIALRRLAQQRQYLVAELLSFFPLNPVSETECAIVNIILPNLYSSWPALPPEILAAALGYLVHLHTVMIGYLDVCLPYRMEFSGSRSKIWRENITTKQYVLFNQIESEFRIALEMLNWNVIHLCISQGMMVSTESSEKTLPNLLTVLRSPHLGSYGVQCRIEEPEEDLIRSDPGLPVRGPISRTRGQSISSLPMPHVTHSYPPIDFRDRTQSAPKLMLRTTPKEKEEEDFVVIDNPTVTSNKEKSEDMFLET